MSPKIDNVCMNCILRQKYLETILCKPDIVFVRSLDESGHIVGYTIELSEQGYPISMSITDLKPVCDDPNGTRTPAHSDSIKYWAIEQVKTIKLNAKQVENKTQRE